MGRRPWEAMARSCDWVLRCELHLFRSSITKYDDCGRRYASVFGGNVTTMHSLPRNRVADFAPAAHSVRK